MEEFEGYVDRITFRNEENGYTVLYLVKPQTDSEEEEEEFPDEPDGAFSQAAAGFHRFLFQIRLEACYILVGVRLPGHGFELQSHGGYFQPAGEGGDDPPLLLVGAEQEVDGLNLQDLDKPAISGFDDAVFELFDRNEVLNELQLFFWRGACPSSFSGDCLCACSCHSGIQSSYSEAAAGAPET